MNRTLAVIASLALFATTAIAGDRARDRDPVTASDPIGFKLELEATGSRFQLSLSMGRDSRSSTQIAPGQIGLDSNVLDRGGPVRFSLAREPGRLDCAGDTAKRIATGDCTFTPATEFSRYLAGRGIGTPSFGQSFDLTLVGADKALVDALADAKYPRPTIDQLVALAALKATPAYIADLAGQGFCPDDLDDLIAFAALKIDGNYAGAMLRAGLGNLTAKELIEMKAVGVDPDFLAGLKHAGLRKVTADDAVQLRAIGVDPAYVREIIQLGYPDITADQLTEMRAVGVTANDIRRAREIGMERPTADQLVQLHVLRR